MAKPNYAFEKRQKDLAKKKKKEEKKEEKRLKKLAAENEGVENTETSVEEADTESDV